MAYYQGNNPFKKIGDDKYTTVGLPEHLYTSSGKKFSSDQVSGGELSIKDPKTNSVGVEDDFEIESIGMSFKKGERLFTSKSAADEYRNKRWREIGTTIATMLPFIHLSKKTEQ